MTAAIFTVCGVVLVLDASGLFRTRGWARAMGREQRTLVLWLLSVLVLCVVFLSYAASVL